MNEIEKESIDTCVAVLRNRAIDFLQHDDVSMAQSALTASEALRAIRETLEVYDAGIGRAPED